MFVAIFLVNKFAGVEFVVEEVKLAFEIVCDQLQGIFKNQPIVWQDVEVSVYPIDFKKLAELFLD